MTAEFYLNNGLTVEDLSRELCLSAEETKAFVSSGMDFQEWTQRMREVKYGVFYQFMMDLYDDLDRD